jgi:hypothetical protein
MAVVPFTYLKPGVWELQCSGDLMSDILGTSWRYSVHLQVLPQSVNGNISRLDEGENAESPDYLDTTAPVQLAIPAAQTINIIAERASTTDLPKETAEDLVIDQPVSPVWFKGETAEQILHNLIELALPTSESLLVNGSLENESATPTSPPLLLTLDQGTYVARWGESLTINGRVELTEKANLEAEPQHLYALELGVELRSPQGAEILTRIRQPLPDEVLPFTIRYAIDIPAEYESKLILADIGLYGAFTDLGEVILLANQSFTITADVTELLAISAALASSTARSDDQSLAITPPVNREPESSVKLDLSLVNLVKSTKKDQSLVLSSSTSTSLPPGADSRMPKKSASTRGLQLPNLPPMPTHVIAISDLVWEREGVTRAIAAGVITADPKPEDILDKEDSITPINLEQLVIRNRPVPTISKAFPYLKRLPASPDGQEEVSSNVPEALAIQTFTESEAMDITNSTDESIDDNTPQLVAGDIQPLDESVAELAVPPQSITEAGIRFNSELVIEGNPNSSPLIRKWLQSQGYILPEPIHVPDQDDDTYLPPRQTISRNQVPLPPAPELPTFNLDLPLLDIEPAISRDEEAVKLENIQPPENTVMIKPEEAAILADLSPDHSVKAVSGLRRPVPPLPPPHRPKPQPAWLSQEIVVDDIDIEPEANVTDENTLEQPEQPDANESPLVVKSGVINEPLPIPQLHVPEGELIAGKSVTIRLELPELSPQVAIKLWVEDYQTRWLLDGPHLLKNLLPTPMGGLEVITQLTIPFGCMEIRLEAIALNLVTQQESHKVTIVRQVIPPDLPTLQLDELLGI